MDSSRAIFLLAKCNCLCVIISLFLLLCFCVMSICLSVCVFIFFWRVSQITTIKILIWYFTKRPAIFLSILLFEFVIICRFYFLICIMQMKLVAVPIVCISFWQAKEYINYIGMIKRHQKKKKTTILSRFLFGDFPAAIHS